MGTFVEVFCGSGAPMTRQRIIDFVTEGTFFDDEPQFVPQSGTSDAARADWQYLGIYHGPDRKPVMVRRYTDPGKVAALAGDAVAQLRGVQAVFDRDALEQRLRASAQVFDFSIDPEEMTDESWEMVDVLERYLARSLDGVLYASDGFYDRELEPICKW